MTKHIRIRELDFFTELSKLGVEKYEDKIKLNVIAKEMVFINIHVTTIDAYNIILNRLAEGRKVEEIIKLYGGNYD